MRTALVLAWCSLLACGGAKQSPAEAQSDAKTDVDKTTAPTLASAVIPTDEVLWALGPELRERTLAVSNLADDVRYSQVAGKWPERVVRLGLNPEEVIALRPDVVFVASFSTPEYRAALEGRVKVVELQAFDGFAGYFENLDRIGDAADARAGTDALKAEFETRRAAIAAKAPSQSPTCLAWSEGYVPGKGTTFFDVAQTAGCVPIAADKGIEGHQPLDLEQILAWDPEVLVVGCNGDCDEAEAALASRPGLSALRSVREGKVAVIPDAAIGSVGAGMLDFAEALQAQL